MIETIILLAIGYYIGAETDLFRNSSWRNATEDALRQENQLLLEELNWWKLRQIGRGEDQDE